ncbi:hypothetical protein [Aliidiomarina sp.]|uniref:hypothetical protein n=1 Tax=Aliidiomarina sp. TaxID=1872439 RepID=UPI003A4E3172
MKPLIPVAKHAVANHSASKQRQRGMYLLLTALLAVGILFVLMQIIALSQKVQRQTEIEQVAHYAAESMGVIAARDLNLKAILNRAMLANEMAIGQIIGLHTWYEMSRQTSTNIATVTVWIPYLNSVSAKLSQLMNQMREPMRTGVRRAIVLQQWVIHGLASAQQVFHQASWLASVATAIDIVEGTDESLEVVLMNHQTLLDLDNIWLRMQSATTSPSNREDYVDMVADSRDPFSRKRTYRWFSAFNVAAHKAGGSEISTLADGRIAWRSLDTSQLHLRYLLHNQYLPIGGGASYLQQRLPSARNSHGYGDSYRINWTTSRYTVRKQQNLQIQHRSPHYFRYQSTRRAPQITVVVRERLEEVERDRTPQWGVGRVELYFHRPKELWAREDNKQEIANLHNALWQVRRKNILEAERRLIGAQL